MLIDVVTGLNHFVVCKIILCTFHKSQVQHPLVIVRKYCTYIKGFLVMLS